MDARIKSVIVKFFAVYEQLREADDDCAVIIDQCERGTLQPDRIREHQRRINGITGHLPEMSDLLEGLSGVVVEDREWDLGPPSADPIPNDPEEEAEAEVVAPEDVEPDLPKTADYDAEGSTPVEPDRDTPVDVPLPELVDEETAAEGDATGTP